MKTLPYLFLDIDDSEDLEAIINTAKDRAASRKTAGECSQKIIRDTTHLF
jgi:2-phospho-L-lactate guanylyltransferase (CobY/MobA/RfbA family)